MSQLVTNKSVFSKWIVPPSLSTLSRDFFEIIDFSTLWIIEQRANLPANIISVFMKQMKQKTTLEDDAFKILRRQRQLPDVAIKELVEWLRYPNLSWRADGILGNQASLPKETIDSAIENLFDCSRSNFWALWDPEYNCSVCLRQDLHAEAIGKVWDFLEKEALRGNETPDHILLDLSRMHLIQSDDIERLGTFLEKRLRHIYTESRKIADEALGQQACRATNVLKVFVKLFRDEQSALFKAAQHILQKQPALSNVIIDKLRNLFEIDKLKVVAVLKERLSLPNEAIKWLARQITEGEEAEIKCREAVDYLLGQSDLPDYLADSLPELIVEGVNFGLVAKLLGQQKEPSSKVINRFVELIPYKTRLYTTPEVIFQQAFADPLTQALKETSKKHKSVVEAHKSPSGIRSASEFSADHRAHYRTGGSQIEHSLQLSAPPSQA